MVCLLCNSLYNLRTPIHPSITLVLRLLCWILND
nr:MAG TPA: hypothetical protein [Caudoviricetes sp.]